MSGPLRVEHDLEVARWVQQHWAALTDPGWVRDAGLGWRGDFGRTPNLLWPAEPHAAPAWMVATGLDLDVTPVGGSGHLIGRVLAHPSFEADRVRPSDPLV